MDSRSPPHHGSSDFDDSYMELKRVKSPNILVEDEYLILSDEENVSDHEVVLSDNDGTMNDDDDDDDNDDDDDDDDDVSDSDEQLREAASGLCSETSQKALPTSSRAGSHSRTETDTGTSHANTALKSASTGISISNSKHKSQFLQSPKPVSNYFFAATNTATEEDDGERNGKSNKTMGSLQIPVVPYTLSSFSNHSLRGSRKYRRRNRDKDKNDDNVEEVQVQVQDKPWRVNMSTNAGGGSKSPVGTLRPSLSPHRGQVLSDNVAPAGTSTGKAVGPIRRALRKFTRNNSTISNQDNGSDDNRQHNNNNLDEDVEEEEDDEKDSDNKKIGIANWSLSPDANAATTDVNLLSPPISPRGRSKQRNGSLDSATLSAATPNSPGLGQLSGQLSASKLNDRRPKQLRRNTTGSFTPSAAAAVKALQAQTELLQQAGTAAVGCDDTSVCISEESSQSSSSASDLLDMSFDRDDDDEDYLEPETDEFWDSLPFVPNNFADTSETAATSTASENQQSADTSKSLALRWLDPEIKTNNVSTDSSYEWSNTRHCFAREHRLFSRALLQLLAERDQVGVEDSIHDSSNIIKKGPLKKKTKNFWRVKYLELRKGNLVYYGDMLDSSGQSGRKTIHLRQATSVCTPTITTNSNNTSVGVSAGINMNQNANGDASASLAPGFGLDLWVEGRRYCWLANTEDERQAWIRAFRQAMIGETIDDEYYASTASGALGLNMQSPFDNDNYDAYLAPHEEALQQYRAIQSKLFAAGSRKTYMTAISPLFSKNNDNLPSSSSSLQIPVLWVREQEKRAREEANTKKDGLSPQRRLKTTIAQFWKNMGQYTFAINGHSIESGSPYAEERTLGALARCILEYDKTYNSAVKGVDNNGDSKNRKGKEHDKDQDELSEFQAVSYARRIIMSIIRSKTLDDISFAAEYLCGRNKNLVRVDQVKLEDKEEPLHIDVSYAGDDFTTKVEDSTLNNDISGWVFMRRRVNRTWNKRFCVLSAGVMSYYEYADPRPHGLRAQLVLGGAKVRSITPDPPMAGDNRPVKEDSFYYILHLHTVDAERERQIAFTKEKEFNKWKIALQNAIDSCSSTMPTIPTAMDGIIESGSVPGNTAIKVDTSATGTVNNTGTTSTPTAGTNNNNSTPSMKSPFLRARVGGMRDKNKNKPILSSTGKPSTVDKVITGGVMGIRRMLGQGTTFRIAEERRRKRLQRAPSGKMLRNASSKAFYENNSKGSGQPRVQCIVQASEAFRVFPADLMGDDPDDAWISMRVKLFQAYLLSGGSNGRLARGDALIEIELTDDLTTII